MGDKQHAVQASITLKTCALLLQSPSLQVEIECGIEERIASVDEPSTCTYVAKVVSPAACDSHYAKELDLTIEPAQEAKEVEPAVLEPEL